jgi:hypothetical protein
MTSLELLPHEPTTFYYIGEDTRRALMFDPRRLEAARKEREEKRRSLPLDGAGIVARAKRRTS